MVITHVHAACHCQQRILRLTQSKHEGGAMRQHVGAELLQLCEHQLAVGREANGRGEAVTFAAAA